RPTGVVLVHTHDVTGVDFAYNLSVRRASDIESVRCNRFHLCLVKWIIFNRRFWFAVTHPSVPFVLTSAEVIQIQIARIASQSTSRTPLPERVRVPTLR